MKTTFNGLCRQAKRRVADLRRSTAYPIKEARERYGKVAGIYVFFEAKQPQYVGRTKNFTQRMGQHTGTGGDRYNATFAFRLAKERADEHGLDLRSKKGADLEKDSRFSQIFKEQKGRVGQMMVSFVEVKDPNMQYLVEFAASLVLKTPHNTFETH